jgi:hypothetical protein
MCQCTLYPQFSIASPWSGEVEYRIQGKRYQKRTILLTQGADNMDEWRDCGQANYALALLRAHQEGKPQ